MMFPRPVAAQMRDGLSKPGTALILYGPRQAGKTTLVQQLLKELPAADAAVFVGDDLYTQSLLARHELEHHPPKAWRRAYPEAAFEVATRQNWAGYLEGE